ncbi:hypothetical protein nbrc107696_45970 [Gordonia spumicola]|uniref:Uncharacterized protein n=1 Tax=Gordonia spumicola TaxID=589161 RepID=A0A7I9V4V9_9ACTN|nr:hypothetical protein [Gordonia spumicola]GEE00222.1 hypothetical protein nbrc107696_06680 [Gordonia spumicola]GEE04151.1 hypothetical protein nbrc107696_45970 [Gordonia spumicola]
MSDLMDAATIAERLSPPNGRPRSADWVRRKMVKEWPHTKVGGFRGMTEAQFQETLARLRVEPNPDPADRPSGLSPRSRSKRAS